MSAEIIWHIVWYGASFALGWFSVDIVRALRRGHR